MDCAGVSNPNRKRKAEDFPDNWDEDPSFDTGSQNEFDCGESSEEEYEYKEMPFQVVVPVGGFLDPTQQDLGGETSSGPTIAWNTTEELLDLKFNEENVLYGEFDDGKTPIDLFNFFFEDSFLNMICVHTNERAKKIVPCKKVLQLPKLTVWKELTVDELKVFLGLLFHMGTISLSRIQEYWKKDRLFSLKVFGEQMSRNRFLIIMKCLYFTPETESEDRFYIIQKVIDYFNNKMENCYYPHRDLILEEPMTLWGGKLYSRQLIKNSQMKSNGIKLHTLVESDGPILKVSISSKTNEISKVHNENIVLQLLQEKFNKGHAVYMDDYYNSFGLAKHLLNQRTYCTGPLRKDLKDNPIEIRQASLKEGDNISRFCDGVHIGIWKHNRDSVYITTQYPENMISCDSGVTKPEALVKYEGVMSRENREDTLLTYYPLERISIRWDLKVAIHIFQLLFMNSFKMYNRLSEIGTMRFYDFRIAVINSLLPCVVLPMEPLPIEERHKLTRIKERAPSGRLRRKGCRQCKLEGKPRKDTYYHCLACSDYPGLCVVCFDVYHLGLIKVDEVLPDH